MSTQTPNSPDQSEQLLIRDGAELKQVLRVSGYTQREIAEYVGFSRSYVNSVCNGLTPLTLRVVQGVYHCLGSTLYTLAVKRARQIEAEERRRYDEWRRQRAEEAQREEQEQLRREEQRRQRSIIALSQQVQRAEQPVNPVVATVETPPLATSEDPSAPPSPPDASGLPPGTPLHAS